MKLLAALLVVAIHSELVVDIENLFLRSLLLTAESCAVPVFFCITGYFLQEKAQAEGMRKVCKKWLCKYVRLYIMLSLAYLPLTFYGMYVDFEKNGNLVKVLLKLIKNYLLVGEQFYSWPLWYLLSVILGLALLSILPPMKNGEKLLLSCVVFAGAWVISEYASVYLVKATIGTGRIFTGFSYLLLGILVYQWKYFFQSAIGWIIPALFWCAFSYMGARYSTTSLFAVFVTPWIVGYAMRYSANVKDRIAECCRKISAWIYYSHMYFLFVWMYILPIQQGGIESFAFAGGLSFGLSCLVCLRQNLISASLNSRADKKMSS